MCPSLPPSHIQDSDALEVLVSYVAVESGNLRAMCAAVAEAAAGCAADVLQRNRWADGAALGV